MFDLHFNCYWKTKIVQNFIGAIPPGNDTPTWFKELETSFRNLPAITKWREDRQDYAQTRILLNNLINALVEKPLTVSQRKVIMSAINHITSYNREAKQALYEYANGEPLIFKTLALTIQDIRPDRAPDITLKHSFEADWLSTSPEVEERFYRIALVDSNFTGLSDRAKKIGQRLENCKDVHSWTRNKLKAGKTEGKTEEKTEDGEIKTIMLDAMNLLKDSLDRDDRIYIYHIIRYIAMINPTALETFIKELEEEDFREAVIRILFVLHGKNLIDKVPENSLEGKLLSDLDTGPLLERTALKLIMSSNPPPENIRALSNRILSQGANTNRWTSTHDDPESAYAVLRELIGLIGSKQRKKIRLTAWENEILMRLLAYLNRWNPFIKREIQNYIPEDETFLEFLATRISREYPDGAYVDAPKVTFEHKLLANTYLAERFARHELRYLNSRKTFSELRWALKQVDGLPNRWYEDPLAPEPRKIVQSLLTFLKNYDSSSTDGQANIAVKLLQHLSQFQPALKELILVELSQERSLQLRLHLRNYREMFKSNKRRVNTRLFVDWLNDLPELNDTSKDREGMVPRYSFRKDLWNVFFVSKERILNIAYFFNSRNCSREDVLRLLISCIRIISHSVTQFYLPHRRG